MAPLTDTQEKVLYLVGPISAALSVVGSSTILYILYLRQKKDPYQRILAAMSLNDILFSTTMAFMPFLLPTSGGRVWAFGNQASCSAMGFFAQVGMATYLYNISLTLYFNLTIVHGMPKGRFARRAEPWLHGISFGFPLLTAIAGLALQVYDETPVGLNCWVTGEENHTLGFAFGSPFFLSLLILLGSNLTIYCTLKRAKLPDTNRQAAIERVQDVAHQATLYVLAAYSTSIGDLIVRSYEVSGAGRDDESDFYWALLMGQILYPMQGLWNFIVFLRPQYLRFRRHECYAKESWWWCFRNAIFSEKVGNPIIATSTASTPQAGTSLQGACKNTSQLSICMPDTPTTMSSTNNTSTVATEKSSLSFFMSVFHATRKDSTRLSRIIPENEPPRALT